MVKRAGLTIGLIILIAEIFLLVNAEFAFPGQGDTIQKVMMIYLVMQALMIASLDLVLPTLDLGITGGIYFVIGFIITALVVVLIPAIIPGSLEVLQFVRGGIALFFMMIYVFIKAFVEEVIFRGILENYLGRFVSAVLFGLFHAAVLSIGNPALGSFMISMIFLMILGLIWSYMKDYFGILGATGSHMAWNMHALGLLGTIVGG